MKRVPRSPLRDRLATNMRLLRSKLGWSQERLAHEANLNRTYLSAVERGEQNISIDNLWKIAVALGVAPQSLLEPPKKSCEK